MAFIEPMHRNKPNITYLMLCIIWFLFSASLDFIDYTAYMDYMDLAVHCPQKGH